MTVLRRVTNALLFCGRANPGLGLAYHRGVSSPSRLASEIVPIVVEHYHHRHHNHWLGWHTSVRTTILIHLTLTWLSRRYHHYHCYYRHLDNATVVIVIFIITIIVVINKLYYWFMLTSITHSAIITDEADEQLLRNKSTFAGGKTVLVPFWREIENFKIVSMWGYSF